MSLCCRQQRELRAIEACLLRSDSHLAAMLDVFGRLYSGQDMPAPEKVPSWQDRDRRAVTRIMAVFATVALAISVIFSAVLAQVASVRRVSVRPSADQPESAEPGRQANGQWNPRGHDRPPSTVGGPRR